MEQVGKIIKDNQLNKNLQTSQVSLQNTSPIAIENGEAELTIYTGSVLTVETVITEVAKIKAAFPSVTSQFVDILIERAIAKRFTAERLIDAVNNVIDNFQYPMPSLANFLSYDRRVKILSYDQLCDMVTRHRVDFNSYTMVKVNGKSYWVSNADKDLYNLPNEI